MADAGISKVTAQMRVLVVDDEVSLRLAVERKLRKVGMQTASAGTVRQAIERLRAEPFDVVLCDLRMPGGDGEQLVEWIASFSPSTRIVVLSAFVTPRFRELYGASSSIRILEKPIELETLVRTLAEFGPRRGFYGNAIEVELFDYVQMIALSGRDKLIEVVTPAGIGRIWFEHGDIVHAEYDDLRGENAFYKLLSEGRGNFKEMFVRPPPMRTVTRSSTHLLMEAAKQADEGVLGRAHELESYGEDAPPPEVLEDEETSFHDLNPQGLVANGAPSPEAVAGEPSTPASQRPATPWPAAEDDSAASESGESAVATVDAGAAEPVVAADAQSADLEGDEDAHDVTDEVIEENPLAPAFEEADLAIIDHWNEVEVEGEDSDADAPVAAMVDVHSGAMPMHLHEHEAAISTSAGHAMFDDPDTRKGMLQQFWQFEGVNGVAIISSTGKVLAEDMRNNSSLVTLAGFYMRGAARIARTLGHNVFDGVVARSGSGQQMVMVSMGAASAVLSIEAGYDPEAVRDAVMGVE